MHYKNGREAKLGDAVIDLQTGQKGILYDTVAGNKQCSARLANFTNGDPYVTVATCLHLDDVSGYAEKLPDTTKPIGDRPGA